MLNLYYLAWKIHRFDCWLAGGGGVNPAAMSCFQTVHEVQLKKRKTNCKAWHLFCVCLCEIRCKDLDFDDFLCYYLKTISKLCGCSPQEGNPHRISKALVR